MRAIIVQSTVPHITMGAETCALCWQRGEREERGRKRGREGERDKEIRGGAPKPHIPTYLHEDRPHEAKEDGEDRAVDERRRCPVASQSRVSRESVASQSRVSGESVAVCSFKITVTVFEQSIVTISCWWDSL